MSRYDDLFDDVRADSSVFADKSVLDPLAEPEEIVPRTEQERAIASILIGVTEGYLPTTVSIYGPPGTGKTTTTRRLCQEFAARHPEFGVEYVNLKECRSIFSVANEILLALGGEKRGSHVGVDGVFEAIWDRLERYPEWTVLILDEIDHLQHDANYDPSDFFYRLLRGEGKLARNLNLSVFLISNELLTVDLRLDSRVESAMGGEEVFFPPYNEAELRAIVGARIDRAFIAGAMSTDALALSGRTDEAVEVFEDVVGYANPLGLFSEEVDPSTGAHLGNTPQAFSHVGLINSVLYLESVSSEEPPEPLPRGADVSNEIR